MSKESFARGFCKVAQEHGVDPVALAKYAADSFTEEYLGDSVSNPTRADYENLKGINDEAVNRAAQNLTLGDYLKNMLNVDPRQAGFWLSAINSRGRGKDLGKPLFPLPDGRIFSDIVSKGDYQDWMGEPLTRRIATGHYANITNLLDRAGLWDAKARRPTLKGYGLEAPAAKAGTPPKK